MRNNRGITLLELMVSISLISIIVLFLFALLVDVKNADNRRDFDRENQQNRALILKTIQTEFLERELIGLRDLGSDSNHLKLTFTYNDDSEGILEVYKDSVSYKDGNGNIEKWPLKKGNSTTYYNVSCVSYLYKNSGAFFSIKISIPLVVQKSNKNAIDDLEFFYLSYIKSDMKPLVFPSAQTLGKYDYGTCSY